jgi:CII-binding regulator of phage lambda lysogenization HflD
MDNISDLNIYPLNEENLQALLDYFFPHLPKGNVKDLFEELKKYDLSLIELEYAAIKIIPYISKIKNMLGSIPTQTNALDYSIHILFDLFSEQDISPERAEIIKTIKGIGVEEDDYENLLSSNTILFSNWVWN